MTPKALNSRDNKWKALALVAMVALVTGSAAFGADEPDLIFRRSTVFKWLTPNDKLATYGIDDPEVGPPSQPSPTPSIPASCW